MCKRRFFERWTQLAGRVNAVVEASRKPTSGDADVDPLKLAARCYFDVKQEAGDYHSTKQEMVTAFAKQGACAYENERTAFASQRPSAYKTI